MLGLIHLINSSLRGDGALSGSKSKYDIIAKLRLGLGLKLFYGHL